MRGKIRGILQKGGHVCHEAPDGIKGLQLASSHAFDVILLDIIMPGMDGLKVLSALGEKNMKTPTIVITADIQESMYRQCIDLGAAAVIYKPPREDELLGAIRDLVAGKG